MAFVAVTAVFTLFVVGIVLADWVLGRMVRRRR
jgi:hypothetical protein